jgi:hypothetical protein
MSNSEEYNSNNSELREYSPETRREILKERRSKRPHPFDKDPVDYPFHNLKSELSIYKKEFKLPNFDPTTSNFHARLEYHLDEEHIDEPTYDYIRTLHEMKVRLMYPTFTETRFQKKLRLPELIRRLNESIELFQQMTEEEANVDSLWMYYQERDKANKTTLLDFVVSLYKHYIDEDIPKRLRPFTEHNKRVIEEFIHYLIVRGADIKNLKKIIDHKTLADTHLYHVIFRGLFNKSPKPLVTLKNYSNRHNSIKKRLKKELNTSVVTHLFVKKSLPHYLHKTVKSYL